MIQYWGMAVATVFAIAAIVHTGASIPAVVRLIRNRGS